MPDPELVDTIIIPDALGEHHVAPTLGDPAAVAVNGDAAGSVSAKLRGINKFVKTIYDLLATLVTGGRWKVDGSGVTQPVSAAALPLPAGAATAANQASAEAVLSVIAGSMPVSSVPPLSDVGFEVPHIGQIGGHSFFLSTTVANDTSAYAAGDVVQDDSLELPFQRHNAAPGCLLTGIGAWNTEGLEPALTVWFFYGEPSSSHPVAHDPFTPDPGDIAKCLGRVSLTDDDYVVTGGVAMAQKHNVNLLLPNAAPGGNIYAVVVFDDPVTFAQSDVLTLNFSLVQD